MTTETNLTLFPQIREGLKKSDLQIMAKRSVDNLLESGNPIAVAEAFAAMSEFIEAVKKDDRFKDYVLQEVAKYGKGTTLSSGTKIELAEVGTRYNYEQCNDREYISLTEQKIQLEARIKARETFLKSLPVEGVETLIDDELVRLYPPSKSSTSSFKVTLAK